MSHSLTRTYSFNSDEQCENLVDGQFISSFVNILKLHI